MQYLAFDVGGTGIKHALMDENYRVWDKGAIPTTTVASSGQFVDALGTIHDRYAGELAGIAVSTCGELDPVSGHMFSGGALVFNAGTNLVDLLQARCGRRVTVENDANCALLAEIHDGSLTDATNAVALVIGTGVGGALMINKRIYHGSHFHSGNASFTLANLDGPYTPDRILAVQNGVGGLIRPLAQLKSWDPATIDGRVVFDLVEAGDPDARAVLDMFCARLAAFIHNLQVMLDVDVVAVGGGISARASFIEALGRKVDELFDASFVPLPRPALRACRYGNDANLIGALHHHLHAGTD